MNLGAVVDEVNFDKEGQWVWGVGAPVQVVGAVVQLVDVEPLLEQKVDWEPAV